MNILSSYRKKSFVKNEKYSSKSVHSVSSTNLFPMNNHKDIMKFKQH